MNVIEFCMLPIHTDN